MWLFTVFFSFLKSIIFNHSIKSNNSNLQILKNKLTELSTRVEQLELERNQRQESLEDLFLVGTKVRVVNNNLFGLEGKVIKSNPTWIWFEVTPGVIKRRLRHNLIVIE